MGKISIQSYFFCILSILSVYFLTKDIQIGIIYLAFTLTSLGVISLFKSNYYKAAYFIIVLSVTAGYFIRPLVLADHPELFMYPKLTSISGDALVKKSLYFSLVNFLFISAAFITTVKLFPDKQAIDKESNFLLKHFNIIMLIIFSITLLKFILITFNNTGIKSDPDRDSTYGFVLRLLSPELTFYVCYIYIAKYWKEISFRKKALTLFIIIITSASVFLTGSKIFLALFGVCIFLNLLYQNKKIKTIWALSLTVLSVIGVVFSFAMAYAVKFSSAKDIASILSKADTYTNSKDYLAVGDAVTQRLMGLDGQIAVYVIQDQSNKHVTNALRESFSLRELTLHTLENILPKVKLSNSPNTGKAISENVVGLSSEISHGGSLGLFASLYFACGDYFFLFDILIGLFLALYFIYARRVQSDDLRFILFAIGGYFIIRLVLSGNFDIIMSEFGIEWIMLCLYVKFIRTTRL